MDRSTWESRQKGDRIATGVCERHRGEQSQGWVKERRLTSKADPWCSRGASEVRKTKQEKVFRAEGRLSSPARRSGNPGPERCRIADLARGRRQTTAGGVRDVLLPKGKQSTGVVPWERCVVKKESSSKWDVAVCRWGQPRREKMSGVEAIVRAAAGETLLTRWRRSQVEA